MRTFLPACVVESQRRVTDLDASSQFAIKTLQNVPNVKDIHTSFPLGEVKAGTALPLAHLGPSPSDR